MGALLRAFWQIALLRQGPQSVPGSSVLLWLALLAHVAIGWCHALFSLPSLTALLAAAIGTLAMVAMMDALLLLHRRRPRLVQSLTALAVCENIIGVVALPLTAWFLTGGVTRDFAALLPILVLGWNIAVAAHIVRHALNTTMGVGLAYAIAYTVIAVNISGVIVPTGG